MNISFSPQRRDCTLTVIRSGDILTINGEQIDFSIVPDGAAIPAADLFCQWIVGPVERVDGDLHLTLILPHGPNPSDNVAFPSSIISYGDGPISLPAIVWPE